MVGSGTRRLVAGLALSFGLADPLAAQIDYRNLDGGRPSRVADAYPIERYAFEFSLPYGLCHGAALTGQAFTPHLEWGAARNVMVGLGAELGLAKANSPTFGGLDTDLFWNVRRETESVPALAVSAEYAIRRFGRRGTGSVGVLATRSFGRYRLHVNASTRLIGADSATGLSRPKWWAGLALDRTLIRSSTVWVADLTVERIDGWAPAVWRAGIGARRQITPTWVMSAGVRQALGRYDPTEFSLGLSHAFAVAALMRGGRR